MTWKNIVKLAFSLFIAQFVVGFLEGVLAPSDAGAHALLVGHAASFVVCSTIFAFFAARQSISPFAHAWAGLLLQILMAVSLSVALHGWLGSTPWLSVAIEWAVLVLSLIVGTSIGIGLRHGATKSADA